MAFRSPRAEQNLIPCPQDRVSNAFAEKGTSVQRRTYARVLWLKKGERFMVLPDVGEGGRIRAIAEMWPREEAARLKSHNLGVERKVAAF